MSMPDAPARCRESTSSRLQDGSWDLHEVQQRVSSVWDPHRLKSTPAGCMMGHGTCRGCSSSLAACGTNDALEAQPAGCTMGHGTCSGCSSS